jgi:hypothetical protein
MLKNLFLFSKKNNRKIKDMKIKIIIKYFGFLLIFMPSISLTGQYSDKICQSKTIEDTTTIHLLGIPYRDINPFSEKVIGSNQWGWGTVYLNNGDSVPGRYILYNAVGSNLLWIRYSKESGLLVDKSTIDGFSILSEKQNKLIRYRYFSIGNWFYSDGSGAFFEELVQGNISLYRLSTIEKFPLSDEVKPHKYYFIYSAEKGLSRVMLNRKSLCTNLNSKEFLKYMREHKLRANKHERIIKAIEEYNRFISVNPKLLKPVDAPSQRAL